MIILLFSLCIIGVKTIPADWDKDPYYGIDYNRKIQNEGHFDVDPHYNIDHRGPFQTYPGYSEPWNSLGSRIQTDVFEGLAPLDNLGAQIQSRVAESLAPLNGLGQRIQNTVMQNLKDLQSRISAGQVLSVNNNVVTIASQGGSVIGSFIRGNEKPIEIVSNGDHIQVTYPNGQTQQVYPVNGVYDLTNIVTGSFTLNITNVNGTILLGPSNQIIV